VINAYFCIVCVQHMLPEIMMTTFPEKVVLQSTTKITLNDRFVLRCDTYVYFFWLI